MELLLSWSVEPSLRRQADCWACALLTDPPEPVLRRASLVPAHVDDSGVAASSSMILFGGSRLILGEAGVSPAGP